MTPIPHEPCTFVDTPASVRAGTSRREAFFDGLPVAELDYQVCTTCQRGIIHHVRVDPAHRRCGLATSLITAVQRAHPNSTWSTAEQIGGPAAKALWRSVGLTSSDSPVTCRHMRDADGPKAESYGYETPWSSPRR